MKKPLWTGLVAGVTVSLLVAIYFSTRGGEDASRDSGKLAGVGTGTDGGGAPAGAGGKGRDKGRRDQSARGKDFSAAQLRHALETGNKITRLQKANEIFSKMTAENAPEMREIFLEFGGQDSPYDAEWKLLWHHWAKIDPEGAIAALESEGVDGKIAPYENKTRETIFASWAELDPDGPRNYLAHVTDKNRYYHGYLGAMSGMTLEEATSFTSSSRFTDEFLRFKSAEALVDRSLNATGSPQEMKDWYETVVGGDLKDAALGHVCWRLRKRDLDGAAQWLKEQGDKGVDISIIARDVAVEYAGKDPAKGLEWYMSLPEKSRLEEGMTKLRDGMAR